MGTYTGTSGDDIFTGSGGADTMTGLAGNDTYYVDDAGDVVVEETGGGLDRIAASVSYVLAANAEVEQLEAVNSAATAAMDLTGNDFVNLIIGQAGVNFLFANGGNDQLIGLAGNDFLIGGSGADLMYGGTGDDTFYVDNIGDRAYENVGEGTDRIATLISYTLEDTSEVELLEATNTADTNAMDLTGSSSANLIIGNAGVNFLFGAGGNDTLVGLNGNDFLIGGTGADLMYGGQGDDTYYVDDIGDQANEVAGEGTDRIATSISYALIAGSEIELLESVNSADTIAMDLTGSSSANQIIGNNGVNVLRGDGGNDILIAHAGDDFLVGGAGNDTMFGGLGNDTFYVDAAGDVVNESAGQGNDRVASSVSYTLSAEVETLEAVNRADTNAMDLTGNAGANSIVGNDGANILDGKGGSDLLVGYGGADTFAFTTALGAGNVDQIADFTLGLDRILLGGDSGEPFAALTAGSLAAASFVIATQAQDAGDRIIYNSTTGALSYDADGSGAGAAVQFATLVPGLALTAADFTVRGAAGAPAITSAASASIAENSAASTIVYQATATDPQGDPVTWSLTGADAHRLTIDAVTGAVRLKAPADYEARAAYSFSVVASDSSSSTGKAVTLNVTNVGSEDSATTRIFETSSLNGDTSQAQEITVFFNDIDTNPNLYNDDLPSLYISGSISNNVDDDYFKISLDAGDLLILDVDGAPTTLDTVLRIYSSGGTLLAENDDTGVYDPGSLTPPGGHNKDSMLIFRAETSGTYYFSIDSFGHDSSGSYKLNVSVGSVTPAQLLSQDVDALLSGLFWDRAAPALTYGFPAAAGDYPAGIFPEIDPASKFAPFTLTQIDAATEMLGTIASVSGLTFARSTQLPGQADLRFGMTTDGDPAHAYLPTNEGPQSPGGAAWFNRTDFNSPVIGNYAWMGMLHEIGHALGLKHAHETPLAVSEDRDSVEYTVMAYRSYPGQDLDGGGAYTNETWGFAQSLMMLDIAALQRLYGANFNTNAGDSVYSWNSGTGEMSINGAGQGRPGDSGNGSTPSSANRVFLTVWDGGGNDTYDMSNYGFGVRIDLRPGEWSRTSTVQLANLGEGHIARGNIANALLYNGDTRSLIENAIGGGGGDRLIANQAANKLTGNAGADVFQWTSHTHAGIGALADRIMDFLSGTDKIDLGEVDSFPFTTSTNETFTFIGTAAFSGANQLRYEVIDGHAHIFADLNNNRVADFEIIVNNVTTLVATDFIL
jgi:Ca2+-binding RTX toxin-like protein